MSSTLKHSQHSLVARYDNITKCIPIIDAHFLRFFSGLNESYESTENYEIKLTKASQNLCAYFMGYNIFDITD